VPATIGIHVQALDAMLAAATGADYGVAVSAVDAQGPAAGALRPGDVITAIADRAAGTPENALLLIAGLDVSRPAVLQGLRSGRPFSAAVTPRPLQDGVRPVRTAALGVALRRSSRGAVVVDVERGSAAHRAGILAGDVITSVAGAAPVAPRQVVEAYTGLSPETHVVLGIERTGVPLLLAVTRPAR
jgi:S1-C subfamily serine protease